MTGRPRLAATTILLRESVGKGALPEVLLIRRPAQMRTFSDMWVFPGGHVDAADSDKVALECTTLEDRTRLAQIAEASNASKEDEGSSAVGLAVAACRELFEEAGILLAKEPAGDDAERLRWDRLLGRRADAMTDPATLYQALVDEGITLDIGALVPWSRWVSPPVVAKRFDTMFFAAMLPSDGTVSIQGSEVSEHRWVTIDSVVPSADPQEMLLAPPTIINLLDIRQSLTRHGDCATMLRLESARKIMAIHPIVTAVGDEKWAVFPWDPEYPRLSGTAPPLADAIPEHLKSLPGRLSASATARRPFR